MNQAIHHTAIQPHNSTKHTAARLSLYALLSVLFLGILLRILFVFNPGFEADISFWKAWGLAQYDGGILWAAHNSNSNYPTPFFYTLGLLTKIYSIFADPHNFNEYWNNANILFLVISKLPAIVSDFGIFFSILWLGKHARKIGFPELPNLIYIALGSLYLINPISIIDGAWWGQVDSLGVFLFVLSFIFTMKRMPFVAGIVYMIALMTKLQNMIYGPALFLYIWSAMGYRASLHFAFGAVLAFFGTNIEFLIAHDMKRVVVSLTDNYDYFPLMSLNAFNLWWIVSGAKGMQVSDKLLVLGTLNAKATGLSIFITGYAFACLHIISDRVERFFHANNHIDSIDLANPIGKEYTKHFLESLCIIAGTFFLFQADSHDRYAFPVSVFLLLWAPFFISTAIPSTSLSAILRNTRVRTAFGLYVFFSLVYFYNLHTALVFNYPHNGLPIISMITHPFFTIGASVILIGLFGLFTLYIAKKSQSWMSIISITVLVLLLSRGFIPLVAKKPVSLSSLKPVVSQQGYLTQVANMPVLAANDFTKWSRLSTQYMFYLHGIGTHAHSVINYDLGGHFSTFSTDYGIDTEAGAKGTSVFLIYADGKKLFESEKMGRYTYPRHITVDVTGAHTLGLVVTDAGDGINDDHADWLNPVLYPKP